MNLKYPRLPEGYAELEYIESTGTQYIDTGYKTTGTGCKIYAKYEVIKNAFNYVLGAVSTGSNAYIITKSDVNTMYLRCGGANNFVYDDKGDGVFEATIQPTSATLNGETLTHENTPAASTYNLLLFGRNYSGEIQLTAGKIFTVKFWDNSVLVRNFIPVQRNSDSAVGMYDLVNDVFYTNAGTGVFTAGPKLHYVKGVAIDEKDIKYIVHDGRVVWAKVPAAYRRVKWLESTGTQYIDTGVIPNELTSGEAVFELTGYNTNGNNIISAGSTTTNRAFIVSTRNEENNYCFRSGLGTLLLNSEITAQLNTKYRVKTVNTAGSQKLYLDGVLIAEDTTEQSFTGLSLYMFAVNGQGGPANFTSAKIAFAQIWQAGILVRLMLPVVRVSDSKPGMYDVVNDVFYTNAGTGEFIAGNE